MAAGTRRSSITTTPGRSTRGFQFTFGLQPSAGRTHAHWLYRIAAIPVAIVAIAFGLFSFALLTVALVIGILTGGIALWWLRRKALRARSAPDDALEGEFVAIDPATIPRDETSARAAPVKGPTSSPQ